MSSVNMVCLAVSDFNLQPFVDYLRNNQIALPCEVVAAPFGQVAPVLLEIASSQVSSKYDAIFVWTRPEAVIRGYDSRVQYEAAPDSAIASEVDSFADLLIQAARRTKHLFVVGWAHPYFRRGLGTWSMRPQGSVSTLMKMNVQLCEQLSNQPNIYVLDSGSWFARIGAKAHNTKLWYLAKMPFSPEVFEIAARDFKSTLHAIEGRSRKLIVLDLDDTLWGGIVGDVGWENLRLGGHDAIGEAFADFQKALKALNQSGIVLAIASKNDEHTALEAIDRHPEMILRRSSFAAWRINWGDKAQNIVDIAAELNLDLSSVVYIDDSPVERSRIRSALPMVAVPEWPNEVFASANYLMELPYFDKVTITAEDRQRAGMYVSDRKRTETKHTFQSIEDWLQSLELRVSVEQLSHSNVARAAQLFNKTNQMNLSTRRLGEAELLKWAAAAENRMYVFRVADKFGDYGLTGILGLVSTGAQSTISDYVLSCRVMGRGIEELMLALAVQQARAGGAAEIKAQYLPTSKNAPCLSFFRTNSQFKCENDYSFTWRVTDVYPAPPHILVNHS